MNKARVSVVPVDETGALFEHATVSVVQIGPDHIPDLDPDPLDRGLVRLQAAMFGKLQRSVDDVRSWLNWPPGRSRRELGMRLSRAESSDVSMAAVLLGIHDCPFGTQYLWAPGVIPAWPEGLCLVLWRGELYERDGDLLTLWDAR